MDDLKTLAIKYLKSLPENERNSLEIMINNGIRCCTSFAKKNKVNPDLFNQALREIFIKG